MKSRITIEVDFDNGNTPVIELISQHSEDVRDRLVSAFLQSLQHTSRWGKIVYKNEMLPSLGDYARHRWHIIPIRVEEMEAEMKLMKATLAEINSIGKTPNLKIDYSDQRPDNRIDLMSPSEKAVMEALIEVEKIGAHPELTTIVCELDKVRGMIYKYYMNTHKGNTNKVTQ